MTQSPKAVRGTAPFRGLAARSRFAAMSEIGLLTGVFAKTGDIIGSVGHDQMGLPTPCTEYSVEALINHIVGWIQVFDAGCHGRTYEGDAATYRCGDDPASEFRTAADSILAGWRKYGFDRQVRTISRNEMPGEMVFNMTLMEYMAHGWDLATATGQPIPYTEQEAAETLLRAKATLPPEYQGENMPFGNIVPISDDALAIDRLVGFLGRRP